MDEISKFRITGAVIWLILLVVVIPVWFSQPVGFKPEGYQLEKVSAERPLVDHAYVLPGQPVPKAPEPVKVSREVKAKQAKPVEKIAKSTQSKAERPNKQVASKPQWIVRIIAYKEIKSANDLLGRLEKDYEVSIKTFEKSGFHSVRTGPYFSKAKAEQDRQKLDKMLHTKSEVVQLN